MVAKSAKKGRCDAEDAADEIRRDLCVSASLWRHVHQLCASASLRGKNQQHIHPCTLSFRVILCILWLLKKGIVIEIIVSVISCVVINITQCVLVLVKSNEMQGKNLIFLQDFMSLQNHEIVMLTP